MNLNPITDNNLCMVVSPCSLSSVCSKVTLLFQKCYKCDRSSGLVDFFVMYQYFICLISSLQVPTTNPTRHPASTIRSHGSRFIPPLQSHHWTRHLARNCRNKEKASRAQGRLIDRETLWVQHSYCRGDGYDYDAAALLRLKYDFISTPPHHHRSWKEACVSHRKVYVL